MAKCMQPSAKLSSHSKINPLSVDFPVYGSFLLSNFQVIKFVPQQEAWVIERFGKFNRILDPVSFVLETYSTCKIQLHPHCTLLFDDSNYCYCCFQGLAILLPVIDEIKYVQSLKEVAIEIPSQSAITLGTLQYIHCLFIQFHAKSSEGQLEFIVTVD